MLPLDAALSASLQACARAQAVTLNTLIQATFGVLLGRLTGRDDVVFGVTVSGRPAELSGVEQMVGLFINTLPLRMRLSPGLTLAELLHDTQERQSALLAHQHIGLGEIQQAAGIGELFDTLLVFENYPVDREGLAAPAGGLRLGAVEGRDATHYPLTSAGAARRSAAASPRPPARSDLARTSRADRRAAGSPADGGGGRCRPPARGAAHPR